MSEREGGGCSERCGTTPPLSVGTTLFLFGAYTIGKERLVMRLMETLGVSVYVDPAKMKILSCLDLPPSILAKFTTDPTSTG